MHTKGDCIGTLTTFITEKISTELHCSWEINLLQYNFFGNLRKQPAGSFTQESDIFSLGCRLWELSEHIPSFNRKYLCTKAGCTVWPNYHCQEAHGNPVSLPFSENADPLLRSIIEQCRQENPDKRPTAGALALEIDRMSIDQEQLSLYKAGFHKTMNDFMGHVPHTPFCDACYAFCIQDYFSCCSCNDGNFDLCESCVTKGLHCSNEAHQLVHSHMDAAGNLTRKVYVRAKT